MPMWPYIGCSGYCSGGPVGLFLALTLCGVGLPLSEDVLLIGLAPRLFFSQESIPFLSKLLYIVAAVAGVATTDTLTIYMGRALRFNAGILSEKAPNFVRRMSLAIQKQLVVESKRDGERLQEQLQVRLRVATLNVGEQLRKLTADLENAVRWNDRFRQEDELNLPVDEQLRRSWSSSALWKRLEPSTTWVRRITCNTRTSLAAWGQTSASLTTTVASRLLQSEGKRGRNNKAGTDASVLEDPSFLAGIDNRLALGQRWPLALLTGFSADHFQTQENYRRYFFGALLAALTVTLPVQLLLGAALQDWSRKLCYVLIAFAQLCRYGPVWATVFVAIAETVQEEINAAKNKK